MTSPSSDAQPSVNATASQPIVDEVCERTCDLLRQSDVFTQECGDAVCQLLSADRDKMKPAQVLEALSDPTKEAHEDS
jgi:hypothetical protein